MQLQGCCRCVDLGGDNIAFGAGILARADGLSVLKSIFIGAGSALTIFFAALPSYQ